MSLRFVCDSGRPDRRNTIVHDGTDVRITQTDLTLLKSLSVSAIGQVGILSKSHNTEEIIAYISTNEISSKVGELQHNLLELEEDVSILKDKLQLLEEVKEW